MIEGHRKTKNFPVREIIEELSSDLYSQWEKVNVKFQFPVVSDRKALVQRLKNAWGKVNLIALGKITKHNVVKIWESKLDKLFDITTCQCPITLCKETKEPPCMDDCIYKAHIHIQKTRNFPHWS